MGDAESRQDRTQREEEESGVGINHRASSTFFPLRTKLQSGVSLSLSFAVSAVADNTRVKLGPHAERKSPRNEMTPIEF